MPLYIYTNHATTVRHGVYVPTMPTTQKQPRNAFAMQMTKPQHRLKHALRAHIIPTHHISSSPEDRQAHLRV